MHRKIGKTPDDHPRRGGNRHRSSQNKQGAVKDRAYNDPSHLRLAVGRQLQRKGGGDASEKCDGKKLCGKKGHEDAEQDEKRQKACREKGPQKTTAEHKEHGQNRDQRRETPVTGHKAVGENGKQTLSWRVDDAASHYPRRIASKAHAHGWLILVY